DVAFFKDKFEVRVPIQQATVDDAGNSDHMLEGMPQHPPDRLVDREGSALPPAGTLTRRRVGLKRTQSIGVDNDGDLQLVHTREERPEPRQVKVSSAYVGANDHYGHLEPFHCPLGLIRRCFWVLQGKWGGTEIA